MNAKRKKENRMCLATWRPSDTQVKRRQLLEFEAPVIVILSMNFPEGNWKQAVQDQCSWLCYKQS